MTSAPAAPSLKTLLTAGELTGVRALGAHDVPSLLRIVPNRYVVPGALRSLHDVAEGEDVSVLVHVVESRERRMRSRAGTVFEVIVTDGTDRLTLTFFLQQDHVVAWHRARLQPGERIVVFGAVQHAPARGPREMAGTPQIMHPRYEIIGDDPARLAEVMRPVPVYPRRGRTKQSTLRSAFAKALEHADAAVSAVPSRVLQAERIPPLPRALRGIHAPRSMADVRAGMSHLVFEEAFVLQTIFAQRRELDARTPAPALTVDGPLQERLLAQLPFELTGSQLRVGGEIRDRLRRSHPSNLLLQGDVGSGKTIVALRAMLQAVDAGHQAVLLAPTEVLAEQHYRTLSELLGPLGRAGRLDGDPEATALRLLTGSSRTAARRQTLLDVISGEAGLIVGTHALLTESVEFASLALVVIDEQHRFGVDHRRRLRTKGSSGQSPHVLVMSATPIPRTAALATLGDLDLLTLDQSPAGRSGLVSYVVPEEQKSWERRMWSRLAEEVAAGRQGFVVCARIEEAAPSATSDAAGSGSVDASLDLDLGLEQDPQQRPSHPVPAAESIGAEGSEDAAPALPPRGVLETLAQLRSRPELSGVRVGVLHGRMSSEDKQQTMADVAEGRIDVLVATTVVEVGVDVPNASAMVVLDAERFGVSQLHQLRGRVGRGEHPGIAFFATRAGADSPAAAHLREIASTTDGFALAELDLARRGSGDLVGDLQSGLGRTLRFLDVLRDAEAITAAREAAVAVVAEDPVLEGEPALAAAVAHRLRDADPLVERT